MRTTIDGAGRIVIPKSIRERYGLAGGAQVDIVEGSTAIEISPAPLETEIIQTPDGPVARATGEPGPLRADEVRRTIESLHW